MYLRGNFHDYLVKGLQVARCIGSPNCSLVGISSCGLYALMIGDNKRANRSSNCECLR